jgi:hypothetical protein
MIERSLITSARDAREGVEDGERDAAQEAERRSDGSRSTDLSADVQDLAVDAVEDVDDEQERARSGGGVGNRGRRRVDRECRSAAGRSTSDILRPTRRRGQGVQSPRTRLGRKPSTDSALDVAVTVEVGRRRSQGLGTSACISPSGDVRLVQVDRTAEL